jgi:hypothetical protein
MYLLWDASNSIPPASEPLERFKWQIAFPGGIIPAEGGEMNSTGISRLYHS